VEGKDGKLIASLCRTFGVERVESLIREYFASDDDWIMQRGYTVGNFHSQVAKLIAVRANAGQMAAPQATSMTRGDKTMRAARAVLERRHRGGHE
jgi:hypothetical protein